MLYTFTIKFIKSYRKTLVGNPIVLTKGFVCLEKNLLRLNQIHSSWNIIVLEASFMEMK